MKGKARSQRFARRAETWELVDLASPLAFFLLPLPQSQRGARFTPLAPVTRGYDLLPSPPWGRGVGGEGVYETIILSIDPAVSQKSDADRTALVTLGRTENNEIHCLEAIARRISAPELVNLIDDADRRWQPGVILFESNAAFAGIKDLLWKEHGALDYWERVGDDLVSEGMVSFSQLAQAGPDETVIFAWVGFESREHRDQANQKIMADPRIQNARKVSGPFFKFRKRVLTPFSGRILPARDSFVLRANDENGV